MTPCHPTPRTLAAAVPSRFVRVLSALLAALLGLLGTAAWADEAAVRAASQALVQAWNQHDAKAWGSQLAEDVWYTETVDFYKRYQGRDKVMALVAPGIGGSELTWDIVHLRTRPDGVVGVVLVQTMSVLPKVEGKYKAVFTSDPSYARWRRDADGRWRLLYFTSHKGAALAEIKRDEEPALPAAGSTRAASPASAAGPAPTPASRPSDPTRSEPPEYTAFWGTRAQGCNYCHGRPPALPSSETASRIVAIGAATKSGTELRQAMQRKELGGTMDHIVADPALTDAALEVLRSYLVDVRDGALPEALRFDAAGAMRELEWRNERSARDAPATIALLRVSGPFEVDARRSTCRNGGKLAGQSACRVVLRARTSAPAGASGALEVRFAPTLGLAPAPRRAVLQLGG